VTPPTLLAVYQESKTKYLRLSVNDLCKERVTKVSINNHSLLPAQFSFSAYKKHQTA
jgi:hypothetical protein